MKEIMLHFIVLLCFERECQIYYRGEVRTPKYWPKAADLENESGFWSAGVLGQRSIGDCYFDHEA